MARSPRIYCVSPPSYIYEACAWQVREKELTHLRAGLLMTVVKWGKVDLFERVVEDKNFADQISPALVQQVYARHTLGVHVHRSSCLPPVESLTLTLTYLLVAAPAGLPTLAQARGQHEAVRRQGMHTHDCIRPQHACAHHITCTACAPHALHAHHIHCMRTTYTACASHALHAHPQLIEQLLKLNAKTEDVFVSDLFRRDREPAPSALQHRPWLGLGLG